MNLKKWDYAVISLMFLVMAYELVVKKNYDQNLIIVTLIILIILSIVNDIKDIKKQLKMK